MGGVRNEIPKEGEMNLSTKDGASCPCYSFWEAIIWQFGKIWIYWNEWGDKFLHKTVAPLDVYALCNTYCLHLEKPPKPVILDLYFSVAQCSIISPVWQEKLGRIPSLRSRIKGKWNDNHRIALPPYFFSFSFQDSV